MPTATERRLWSEHPRARRGLHTAVLLAALAAGAWFGFALLLAAVVDGVFRHGAALAAVSVPVAAMLALVIVRAGLLRTGEVVAQRAAEEIKGGLRGRLVARLVALGPAYAVGERAGELVHAAGEGVEALDGYVTGFRRAQLLAVIVPVLVAALVLVLDPVAAVILLVAWPVLVLLLALIGGRVREQAERREHELAWLSAHFLDVLRGLPTLRMFGRSAEQADTIESVSGRLGVTTMDVLRTAFQASLVLEWAATGATALVAIEASVRLMAGGLGFGHALAALLLAPEFFLPLRRYSMEYHTGQAARTAAERVYAVLDTPDRAPAVRRRRDPPARLDLCFDRVTVTYESGTRPALAGFSLELPEGSTAALVGPSGAGKSTVASLLLRFVEPDAGRILVADTPLDEIEPARWRALVAAVPQHPWLFAGTAAANIRLGRPGAKDAEVVAAARAAQAHGFISALPAGYDTPVGEGGVRLSGGERQRLAIARAVLRDAPILVLDEPTSHLDPVSEALVLEALTRLRQDRTVLLIAHQPVVARGADRVVAMDAGRAVEALAAR